MVVKEEAYQALEVMASMGTCISSYIPTEGRNVPALEKFPAGD